MGHLLHACHRVTKKAKLEVEAAVGHLGVSFLIEAPNHSERILLSRPKSGPRVNVESHDPFLSDLLIFNSCNHWV